MNNNEEKPTVLDFSDSVSHNILWIKQLSEEHDCSLGMAAQAAMMTMTMMDHHHLRTQIDKLEQDLAAISACLSNS